MKFLAAIPFLAGCSWMMPPSSPTVAEKATKLLVSNKSAAGLEMLAWLGGVAVLAGIALVVVSGGRKGWYPLFIGIGLILLNWLVLTYAHALFIPVVIATGSLTLALGFKAVSSILIHRKYKR